MCRGGGMSLGGRRGGTRKGGIPHEINYLPDTVSKNATMRRFNAQTSNTTLWMFESVLDTWYVTRHTHTLRYTRTSALPPTLGAPNGSSPNRSAPGTCHIRYTTKRLRPHQTCRSESKRGHQRQQNNKPILGNGTNPVSRNKGFMVPVFQTDIPYVRKKEKTTM